ncbi:MAG: flagellar basal body rod protein FlgB [Gammaproteobacteria bacterium]|nr:flagellar basal body rod protein FlgB [Sideroxydans sp.]MBU3904326.1 flagellar basal body rod protein FlgB [Gammaproteobacteria bacterium]MBU4045072.1 flagellar basal body rod protein FlgB [Gammaproteobacteria bacterium]MBU4150901.1 flagellar basal body rod protein FlgB [Gammaproteobacteria bacterium]
MGGRIDELFQFHQVALNLRASRQELIASNIANADTPNYKAKDIDFSSALKGALTGTSATLQLEATAAQHLSGDSGETVMGSPVQYRVPLQPSADGNTVDMDVERAQFADNAMRYEASVRFVSSKAKNVLAALQN